jgi:cell division septum initiation protein DivIVA
VEQVTSDGDGSSFKIVFRGYDRAQVQARIRELNEAAESYRRRAQHARYQLSEIQTRLHELHTTNRFTASDPASTSPPDASGLGTRRGTPADRVLRFAAQQAAEIRENAQREADARRERAHADAAAHRQRIEDDLGERAKELDKLGAARRAVLNRREHELSAALNARTLEADQVRQAAERDAAARRAEAKGRAEEIVQIAERAAAHTRAATEAEHDKLATVSEQVRDHLEALHRLLGEVLTGASRPRAVPRPGPTADNAADNAAGSSTRDGPEIATV